jgi:glutathione S-transferase
MKLYYAPGACSLAPHIAACEAGLPIELVKVDLATHTLQDGTDYRRINPRGYVPALQLDDGTVLTEVAALLQYIAELKPAANLIPAAGTMDRVHVNEWLTFVSSELHRVFSPWLWHKETAASTQQAVRDKLAERFKELDQRLSAQPYLLGAQFTVADIYAFTIVNWCNFLGISLNPYPSLAAFMDRVSKRPAVAQALMAEGLLKAAA